jgi:hypothetical protein
LDGIMKQHKPLIVLAVLLAIAGLVWFRYFKSDNSGLTADAASASQGYQLPLFENPQLRKDRIEAARKTEYKGGSRNIFVAQAEPRALVAQQQPKEKPRKVGPEPPVPDPPPPPLTLPPNMKFYGYGTVPNGTGRRAFLNDGEETYVVPEGGLLLNRFRILKVGNATLEFEELSTGRRGTAPLEEQAPPGPSA